MPIFDRLAVVAVPFPYVERDVRKRRPAVLVTGDDLAPHHALGWVVMITSAGNAAWPGDIPVADPMRAGLSSPSVIRPAKIATVELGRCQLLGELDPATGQLLRQALRSILAL